MYNRCEVSLGKLKKEKQTKKQTDKAVKSMKAFRVVSWTRKASCKYNAFTVYITVHLSWRGMELMRTGTSM